MRANDIAIKTNLLRGTVKYRLRKLGYDTGIDVRYEYSVLEQIRYFDRFYDRDKPRKKRIPNYDMEAEIYFYFVGNKDNSTRMVAEHFNLPYQKVNHIINRVLKQRFVIAESKINFEK